MTRALSPIVVEILEMLRVFELGIEGEELVERVDPRMANGDIGQVTAEVGELVQGTVQVGRRQLAVSLLKEGQRTRTFSPWSFFSKSCGHSCMSFSMSGIGPLKLTDGGARLRCNS